MSGAPPAVLAHGTILAHGVGSRQDLPFGLAVAGAATVLVLSFVALAGLWPAPRLDGAHAGRTLPGPVAALLDSRATRIALAGVGAAFTLYVLAALLIGRDDAGNPVPFVVFILLWVGVVPLSVAFGPVWQRVNPSAACTWPVRASRAWTQRSDCCPCPGASGTGRHWSACSRSPGSSWSPPTTRPCPCCASPSPGMSAPSCSVAWSSGRTGSTAATRSRCGRVCSAGSVRSAAR